MFSKLSLTSEDEILNTMETSLDDKYVTSEKSHCLIPTVSFVIICLLLLVVVFQLLFSLYRRFDIKILITELI